MNYSAAVYFKFRFDSWRRTYDGFRIYETSLDAGLKNYRNRPQEKENEII